jgi:C-terminal processing protease CtpA/Prc
MRMSFRAVVLGLAVTALPLVPAAAQRLSAGDRAELVAHVWSEARDDFASWDRVRADWDSALGASLRLAARPQSDVVFYGRLRRLTALLGDLETTVVPPPPLAARIARPPLALVGVEKRVFLLDYAENDEMRVAQPERLSEILAVQGVPTADWIRDSIVPRIGGATPDVRWERAVTEMLQGERGTSVHLLLRTPAGERRGISVTRSVSLNDRWPLAGPPLSVDSLPDGVVVVRVATLAGAAVLERFDRAFPSFDGVRGLVVDLRGVAGGESRDGYALLARLTAQPFPTVVIRAPVYRPGFRVLGMPDSARGWAIIPPDTVRPGDPRGGYTGPVAVLSSAATAGAAEDFLAAFRNTARGVIIGATSAGSPGQPLDAPLGGHWTLRVTATEHAFPDGTAFTGTGVAPELPVTEKVDDLLAGRDVAVERARAYLATRRE